MHKLGQFLPDVFIVDNNTVTLGSVDIIAITAAENTHIHGLASALTINFSTAVSASGSRKIVIRR